MLGQLLRLVRQLRVLESYLGTLWHKVTFRVSSTQDEALVKKEGVIPDFNSQSSTSECKEVFLINGGCVPTSTPIESAVIAWRNLIRRAPHQKSKSGGMSSLKKPCLGFIGSVLWIISAQKFTARSTPMSSMHEMRQLKTATLQQMRRTSFCQNTCN